MHAYYPSSTHKQLLYVSILLLFLAPNRSLAQPEDADFPWPEGKEMALSLTFDDARLSNVDVGLELFRKHDAKVTFYVNPGPMEERIDQWKEAVADGHEIGNHSIIHPCSGNFTWARSKALDGYSLASMREELIEANQQIEQMLGVRPISFAYPCGQSYVGRGTSTQSYVPLIAELFQSGRGWLNEAPNDPYYVDFAQVQGMEMDGKSFEYDILPLLTAAHNSGSWLVLAGHEIGEGGRQTTRTEMLNKLLTHIREYADDIWLAPVGEVTQHIQKKRQMIEDDLADALTFASTFDRGYDADFSKGDKQLYSAISYGKVDSAQQGITHPNRSLAEGEGKWGNALAFLKKAGPVLFYDAFQNTGYKEGNFEGTLSLWLRVDPEEELEPGYTDPIQITDSGYDDAALWVDFSDKNPRDFRMGVFGDVRSWNPDKIGPDKNPFFNERLVVAANRPFSSENWTHVAVSFQELGNEKGRASFYINGIHQGTRNITEPFSWEEEAAKIFVGLNYVGLIDEVAIFEKSLDEIEVQALYLLDEGLQSLIVKKK